MGDCYIGKFFLPRFMIYGFGKFTRLPVRGHKLSNGSDGRGRGWSRRTIRLIKQIDMLLFQECAILRKNMSRKLNPQADGIAPSPNSTGRKTRHHKKAAGPIATTTPQSISQEEIARLAYSYWES